MSVNNTIKAILISSLTCISMANSVNFERNYINAIDAKKIDYILKKANSTSKSIDFRILLRNTDLDMTQVQGVDDHGNTALEIFYKKLNNEFHRSLFIRIVGQQNVLFNPQFILNELENDYEKMMPLLNYGSIKLSSDFQANKELLQYLVDKKESEALESLKDSYQGNESVLISEAIGNDCKSCFEAIVDSKTSLNWTINGKPALEYLVSKRGFGWVSSAFSKNKNLFSDLDTNFKYDEFADAVIKSRRSDILNALKLGWNSKKNKLKVSFFDAINDYGTYKQYVSIAENSVNAPWYGDLEGIKNKYEYRYFVSGNGKVPQFFYKFLDEEKIEFNNYFIMNIPGSYPNQSEAFYKRYYEKIVAYSDSSSFSKTFENEWRARVEALGHIGAHQGLKKYSADYKKKFMTDRGHPLVDIYQNRTLGFPSNQMLRSQSVVLECYKKGKLHFKREFKASSKDYKLSYKERKCLKKGNYKLRDYINGVEV